MQVSENKAIKLADSVDYSNWTSDEIFLFQISQTRLAMDFSIFHRATENVLDRPVMTHEFVNVESLLNEYLEKKG